MRDTLIHLIDIKGYGRPEVLAEAMAIDRAALDSALASLRDAGLLEETRMGLRLTASGKQAAADCLAETIERGEQTAMAGLYERFEPLNNRYKAALARWQMRDAGDGPQPNDHSDADYDRAVIAEMLAQHEDLLPELQQQGQSWPLLRLYARRLEHARERVLAGEQRYVAAPLIESYHTVWFELHEALIRFSGRTRAAEAAAGRAL